LESLAARDSAKALAKLPFFRDSELLPMALTALERGWATADPHAAATWAARLESSDDQVSAVLGLVPEWAAVDADACLAWSENLPTGNMREVSLVELADAWGSRVPEAAMKQFLAMKSEEGTERGLHAIVTQWALDQPAEAIEYLAALDAAKRRDEFLEAALVSLTNQDPDLAWRQAVRFQDASRIGHVRCMALEAMAESRPHDALRLAESAGNPPELLHAVAAAWASWDKPAVDAWIATLSDPQLAVALRKDIAD
jgi:hypothetical protein